MVNRFLITSFIALLIIGIAFSCCPSVFAKDDSFSQYDNVLILNWLDPSLNPESVNDSSAITSFLLTPIVKLMIALSLSENGEISKQGELRVRLLQSEPSNIIVQPMPIPAVNPPLFEILQDIEGGRLLMRPMLLAVRDTYLPSGYYQLKQATLLSFEEFNDLSVSDGCQVYIDAVFQFQSYQYNDSNWIYLDSTSSVENWNLYD